MKTLLRCLFPLVFISGIYSGTGAQVYLTGEISGSYRAGEYIISGDVVVLPQMTLSFAPGSVLRFEDYAGIMVHGTLVCNGTSQHPVVFTSAKDVPNTKALPEAYDWNGIKVSFEAQGISLEYCTIAYSTFGLNIESNATPVSIKNVAFIHSGSASLTRGKKMIPVQETMPISFNWPGKEATAAEAGEQGGRLADNVRPGESTKVSIGPVSSDKAEKSPNGRRIRRVIFGGLAAGCGVAGVLFQFRSNRLYNDYMDDRTYNVAGHDADWQAVRNAEKTRNVLYTIAGVCAAAFTISIPF